LTCPQRKCIRNLPVFSKEGFGTLFRMFSAAFRKLPVIGKSNTVTLGIILYIFHKPEMKVENSKKV
jgi:hypothetical protein